MWTILVKNLVLYIDFFQTDQCFDRVESAADKDGKPVRIGDGDLARLQLPPRSVPPQVGRR